MPGVEIDRNLLFGVVALQDDFIDQAQFTDLCAGWAMRMETPLADLLIERGWITEDDRREIERKVARKLKKHGGDPRATLGAVAGVDARDAIRAVDHPQVRQSLSGLPPAAGHVLVETMVPPNRGGDARFTLTRLHAEGGLGKVWLGRDNDLNRDVAVKEMKPEQAAHPETWRRFLKEAQVTGQLEHPNIVPVYELTRRKEDDQPFYVMRFVRGQTLRDAIADYRRRRAEAGAGDRLELQRLLGAFVSVCQAIGYAHSRGVVHRDLKPENVVLGGFGEVIVLDWGLAKMVDQPDDPGQGDTAQGLMLSAEAAAGKTHGAIGTPAYMAPEQVEARHDLIDGRTNVYGLGGILFEILTSHPPAEGETTADVYRKILAGAIPRARDVEPDAPRPLEAVCAKALARDRAKRYAKATDLAEDVRRWIADEPVSAYREPFLTRARRWAGRHRTLVTASSGAAAVAVLAVGYFLYDARLRAAQRLSTARGRVDAMTTAEVRAIPAIIEQLGDDRRLVRGRFVQMAREGSDDKQRLPAALALLPDDPAQADYLAGRLVRPEATPDEVLVIRKALTDHRQAVRVAPRLRDVLATKSPGLAPEQLRAAGALAAIAPDDPYWKGSADAIAQKLVHENPLLIGSWREVFQPVAADLKGPLRKVFANRTEREPRALAFTLLFEFATQPGSTTEIENLVALIGDAEPGEFDTILRRLDTDANRGRAVALLAPLIKDPARFDDELARRQGRIAVALLRLNHPDPVWPLFRHRDDPSVRTELIHNLAPFGFDPAAIKDRLQGEKDVSARRALILALGAFPADKDLAERLLGWYRTDPDSGVHGSIDWLLRQRWGRAADLEAIDRSLASPELPRGRDWFVNGQGQTHAVVRGPVEFTMGSTKASDPDRDPDETRQPVRIDRSFAIATREVTLAEYARFLEGKPQGVTDWREIVTFKQRIPSAGCAIGVVTWYDAAKYCNWLSGREGLPEGQWCYPKAIGPGMKLPADYLKRTGYRLPTEAEWEYACRAGAASSRPFGGDEARLGDYGWYIANAGHTMHPVGQKLPNDFGLFDVLGNAIEWCTDAYESKLAGPPGKPPNDAIMDAEFSDQAVRVLRGGAFDYQAVILRSAYRGGFQPANQGGTFGFRPARTYP